MSAVDQTNTLLGGLASYFNSMNTYVSGTGTDTLPTLDDLLLNADYSDLYNLAYGNQKGSSNYPNGTMIEIIHHIVALQREYGIRTKAKADYYDDASTDMDTEYQYFTSMVTQYVSTISGLSTGTTTATTTTTTS